MIEDELISLSDLWSRKPALPMIDPIDEQQFLCFDERTRRWEIIVLPPCTDPRDLDIDRFSHWLELRYIRPAGVRS